MLLMSVEQDRTQHGWFQITVLAGEPTGSELKAKIVRLNRAGLEELSHKIEAALLEQAERPAKE